MWEKGKVWWHVNISRIDLSVIVIHTDHLQASFVHSFPSALGEIAILNRNASHWNSDESSCHITGVSAYFQSPQLLPYLKLNS